MVSAACASDDIVSPPRFDDPASAAVSPGEMLATTHWNGVTQSLIAKNRPNQNAAFRIMAYTTLAQHASVESAAEQPGVTRPAIRGAVAGATAVVLRYLFPADSVLIESVVRAAEAPLSEAQRAVFRQAELAGRGVGTKVVARASVDRFNATWTGTVPTGPGKWSSLAVPPAPPLLPLGGAVIPFFMTSGAQFRAPPPPVFDSPAFREALAEVRRISDTRTPTQDSLAKFWAISTGGLIAGHWNTTGLDLIADARLGERAAAHVLALMNTAAMDAITACHDAKYTYWYIRPPGADPAITTSVPVPNHPSYAANHACISGTYANVLSHAFPSARERMQAKANDAAMSRLYGGIHYRFDIDAGLEIARKVSALAIELDKRDWMRGLVR